MVRALLIFPWLLLCAILIWLIQIAKMLLLDRQSFVALTKSIFHVPATQEQHHE